MLFIVGAFAIRVPAFRADLPMDSMPFAPGTRLGPYEILAPIGAGGMGEVYQARDTRLHRTVAVKVSNEHFSQRFERRRRFAMRWMRRIENASRIAT